MKIQPYKEGMKLDGFIAGMPNEVYHASPGVSKSGLDKINRSPAHYKFAPEVAQTRNMVLGAAMHAALLEPGLFEQEYLLLRDVKDRRVSAYKEAIKNHPENKVLTGTEADNIVGMQEALSMNSFFSSLQKKIIYTELSLFVTDSDGTLLKCRFDAITSDGTIIDLKTTTDARPDFFSRAIFNFRYHVQAAWYSDLFTVATAKSTEFIIIAVEPDQPHAAKIYVLDDVAIEIGQSEYQKDLELYKECEKTGHWPAYDVPDRPELISLPEWAIMNYESESDREVIVV